jgi:ADP-heptose:LPS heptosyltransferase
MMRILALVPGDIDNQILFFPTLATLNAVYPDAQIDVVAETRAIAAYRLCPWVRKTFRFEFSELNSFADWSNLLGQMRDQDYDVVLCAATRWSMGWALWMSGIPQRIGFSGCGAAFSFTDKIPLKLDQYLAQTYHELLLGLDIQQPCPAIAVTIPDQDLKWVEATQTRLGVQPSRYLMLDTRPSANAQGAYPTYPVDRWQTILQALAQRHPELPIVMVQTAGNADVVSAFQSLCPTLKPVSLEEIGKLAGFIRNTQLLLCIENSALQLAVAEKTPAIALLDATAPSVVLTADSLWIGIQASTSKIADIQPHVVLEKVEMMLQAGT